MSLTDNLSKLTPEQEKKLIEYRSEWIEIGRATGPANIPAIRSAINALYKEIGYNPPYIWRCKSPMDAQLTINWLMQQLKKQERESSPLHQLDLGAGLDGLLVHEGSVIGNFGSEIDDQITDSLGKHMSAVIDNSGSNILRRVYGDVGSAIVSEKLGGTDHYQFQLNLSTNLIRYYKHHDTVRFDPAYALPESPDKVHFPHTRWGLSSMLQHTFESITGRHENLDVRLDKAMKFIPTHLWGSQEGYWIAYYLFPHEHIRPIHTDEQYARLKHWETISRNSGWWYPFEKICFVCDRPTEIHHDEEGRLHNETGASVKFSDGYGSYAYHGTNVPPDTIEERDFITVEQIQEEENIELKRVLLSLFGEERFIKESSSFIVDTTEPEIGVLYASYTNYDIEPLVMVKVTNSTPEPDGTYKTYWLRVPPSVETAREAVAWTFGMEPEDYNPSIET